VIEEPPLLTVKKNRRRPTAAQIAAFQGIATGLVVDALFGGAALDRSIQLLTAGDGPAPTVAGPALTVESGPADILATLAALNFVTPGDVVVVAFSGHQGCAAVGDRVCGMMKNAGAAAFVTDGPARDYAGIRDVGLPLWCTGLTPESPFAKGPGKIGFPVQLGGREVESGDMIVADRDGVVVVPFERLDEVIGNLAKVKQLEAELDAEVAAGRKLPDAIAELLESDEVKYEA
jgi:4-hydroxy-4-methyl-2-oxoglutarate aldolase